MYNTEISIAVIGLSLLAASTIASLVYVLRKRRVDLDRDGNVKRWKDLSGNKNHMIQPDTSKRPVLVSE